MSLLLSFFFFCTPYARAHSTLNSFHPFLLISASQSTPGAVNDNAQAQIMDLVHQKRWKDVAALAQTESRKHPGDQQNFYWLGVARLQLQDPIGAVQAFRSAQKLGLDNSLLHEGLGLAYYHLNQFFLFEQQMMKASTLDPQDPRPPDYMGRYYLTLRSDPARALTFLQKAVQLRPDDAQSLYQKGDCLELLARGKEAREDYTRAIALVEKDHEPFGWPYQGIARLLLEENPQQALGFAKKAVEIEPREFSHHLILAKIYERVGNLPEALHEAQVAEQVEPDSSAARYALVKLYQKSGDAQAAQKELKMFERLKAVYGPQ
jgi:Flp pilus assembly protein TadD